MITVEAALERVLAGIVPLPAETVALPQAAGRVLAADSAARVSHPPLAVASMDGWALRAADVATVPARLAIIGESVAGRPAAGTVGPGQAMRIFTGAPVPAGADAVVRQEDAARDCDHVAIAAAVPAGRFIRPAGMDFPAGKVLLRAGTAMGPRHIGLAAAMNLPWLAVRRRPLVAVLSTGDEIRMPGEPLAAAQIPGANGPALAALVEAHGGIARQIGIAADSRDSLAALVEAAAGADLLVTSGGASVGDYDLVGDVLTAAGMNLDFWKIAMKPGKPLMFGRMGRTPVLGLPGNPVSALTCALLFLVPMLRAFAGLPTAPATAAARLGADLPANGERRDHMRATLAHQADGSLVATPLGRQDSAMLSGFAAADCLIIRPEHTAAAKAGDVVTVLPLAGM
jgi:molybdopterin molybdotransferase